MPLSLSKEMDGNGKFIWDIYQETPLMSTYIVAMAVIPKEYDVSKVNVGKRTLGVWSNTYDEVQRNQILNVTVQLISYFENYFDIKEVLPKIDQVQTAHIASAMENWGLVFYKWSGAIDDYKTIAHELAHFWFGNLVTCSNWDK